jgi:hypothetical protein
MKNQNRAAIAIIIGTFCLVPALALAANPDDMAKRVLDMVAANLLKGYTPAVNATVRAGVLAEGKRVTTPVKLSSGKNYGFLAICDASCQDMDLTLTDSSGNEVADDTTTQQDAAVQYTPKKTGQHFLTVEMATCKNIDCAYGIGSYRK